MMVYYVLGVLFIFAGFAVETLFGKYVIAQVKGEESLSNTYGIAFLGLLIAVFGDFFLLKSGSQFFNSHGDGLILGTGVAAAMLMSYSYHKCKVKGRDSNAQLP